MFQIDDIIMIGADIALVNGREAAVIRTNTGKLLIGRLGTTVSEILLKAQYFPFKKMLWKLPPIWKMAAILSRSQLRRKIFTWADDDGLTSSN